MASYLHQNSLCLQLFQVSSGSRGTCPLLIQSNSVRSHLHSGNRSPVIFLLANFMSNSACCDLENSEFICIISALSLLRYIWKDQVCKNVIKMGLGKSACPSFLASERHITQEGALTAKVGLK